MGGFYTVITIKGAEQSAVVDWPRSHPFRDVDISKSQPGIMMLADDGNDGLDDAERLSRDLQCMTWIVMVHDGSALVYWLFDKGTLLDEYTSDPYLFDGRNPPGNAAVLCAALGNPDAEQRVREILQDKGLRGLYGIDRHFALIGALGLPPLDTEDEWFRVKLRGKISGAS